MKSSMASLIIDIAKTNTRGVIAVAGLSGDTILIDCSIAINKKYTLAKRLN